jgi:hypothetical protein
MFEILFLGKIQEDISQNVYYFLRLRVYLWIHWLFLRPPETIFWCDLASSRFANWSPPCRVLVDNISEWFSLFFLVYRHPAKSADRSSCRDWGWELPSMGSEVGIGFDEVRIALPKDDLFDTSTGNLYIFLAHLKSSQVIQYSCLLIFFPKALAKGFSQRTAANFNFSLHLHNISYILYIP